MSPLTESSADIARVITDISPILQRIVGGAAPSAEDKSNLIRAYQIDKVQSAIISSSVEKTVDVIIEERITAMQKAWPAFSKFWSEYFKVEQVAVPVDTLWRVYVPLSQWIVEEKSARRPDDVFVIGVYGSQGRGKTVMSLAVATVLNSLLDSAICGQAVAKSIDDYYYGKERREALRELGYDAGVGVSNRGPAGTHDMAWLSRNIAEFGKSSAGSEIHTPRFTKLNDDRAAEPEIVRGKVGVLLLDGWLVGANTDFNIANIPAGFSRTVAQHLQTDYKPVFDRMDALWAFDTPSFEEILANREQQEQTLATTSGSRGMSPEQIRSFVEYFYKACWCEGSTSAVPNKKDVTFLATVGSNRTIVDIECGGRN